LKLLQAKGDSYAGAQDVTANFKRAASRAKITPLQAWLVLFNKHLDAVERYIRGENLEDLESLHSRVVDLINYLFLLEAIVDERTDNNV